MIETSRRILSFVLDALIAVLVALLLSMGALFLIAAMAMLSQGRVFGSFCPARAFPAALFVSMAVSAAALLHMRMKGKSPAQKILSFMEKLRSRRDHLANVLVPLLMLAVIAMLLLLYGSLGK